MMTEQEVYEWLEQNPKGVWRVDRARDMLDAFTDEWVIPIIEDLASEEGLIVREPGRGVSSDVIAKAIVIAKGGRPIMDNNLSSLGEYKAKLTLDNLSLAKSIGGNKR